MLKTLWVSLSVKTKLFILYIVHIHIKHHDATSPFYKTKHIVTVITQPIVPSHQSNTILLQFGHCNQLCCVQLGLYNHNHAVDVVHTVILVVITIRPQKKLIITMTIISLLETPHTQRGMHEQHQAIVTNAN